MIDILKEVASWLLFIVLMLAASSAIIMTFVVWFMGMIKYGGKLVDWMGLG